jgi:CRISPR-associated protein Cmr4
MDAKLLFIQTLSPLHAGTGQGVGIIDLPIAREKATQIPFLPGSSIKGVFRDACGDEQIRHRVFGPAPTTTDLTAGAVTFTDARLLLLPIRSLRGVFAWVTSPLLLHRLVRDAKNTTASVELPPSVPSLSSDDACLISSQAVIVMNDKKVILEDLPLNAIQSAEVSAWGDWFAKTVFIEDDQIKELQARLCIVSDDILSFFLETATEITARIRIDDNKKTVVDGALWYEEALPAETVLVSVVVAASHKEEVFAVAKSISSKTLQFGGKATVGRGLCKTTLV